MKQKDPLYEILIQFVSLNLNTLTGLEQKIMDIACVRGEYLMPTNCHAEFMPPVKIDPIYRSKAPCKN
jgi:hypothetical protein